jgi:hypothetical protein
MMRYRLRTLMIVLVFGPASLVALYVLSVGPAFAIAGDNGLISETMLRRTYQPVLKWASDLGLQPTLEWYVFLWAKPSSDGSKPPKEKPMFRFTIRDVLWLK